MKEEKPTREERLKAYEYIREWLNENMECTSGFCSLVKLFSANYSIDRFPELMEEKPTGFTEGVYWFSSAKERIQVLTKIINKMKEEPLIKPGQQFKIDSIEELIEAYEKLSPWIYSLKLEIHVFSIRKYNYVVFDKGHEALLLFKSQEEYETIPNPFKKKEQCLKQCGETEPSGEGINRICLKCGSSIVERKDPIREELKALREEVEKLKGELTLIKEQELAKEKQEAINKIHEIMRECLADKKCCKEKPKESEELKGMLQFSWLNAGIEFMPKDHYVEVSVRENDDVNTVQLIKEEAIEIVNYLKKHFEI